MVNQGTKLEKSSGLFEFVFGGVSFPTAEYIKLDTNVRFHRFGLISVSAKRKLKDKLSQIIIEDNRRIIEE